MKYLLCITVGALAGFSLGALAFRKRPAPTSAETSDRQMPPASPMPDPPPPAGVSPPKPANSLYPSGA